MIEQLFGSKTRVKLLRLFFSNPNRSFYVREITRKIDEQINSVRRELANLLSIGIIKSDNSNNRLYYEVNQTYEFYKPLGAIFGQKKIDIKEVTQADSDIKELGSLDLLVMSGTLTRDPKAGVDLLFVGNLNQNKISAYVASQEKQEGHELTYAVLTKEEFNYRRQIKDKFITTFLNAKLSVVYDPHKLLGGDTDNGD